jgi:hypothetical protein
MLLRFGMENYRSIRDRQELSFLATRYNEDSAFPLTVAPTGELRVSTVAAVYGANASGKSNVLRALPAFSEIALKAVDSASRPGAGFAYAYTPFALDSRHAEAPTVFDVEFVLDGVRYVYGIAYDAHRICREWLYAHPHGRRQVWFSRVADSDPQFSFPGEYLKGARATLTDLVRDDTSFLSLGASVRHPQLSPLAEALRNVVVEYPDIRQRRLGEMLARTWDDRMADLVRRADLGVDGAEVSGLGEEPTEVDSDGRPVVSLLKPGLRLRHGGKPLPLYSESDGTLRWLILLRPVLNALEAGGVLVVDELDASLHPTLTAEVIRMFRDRRLNARGAQLLFSSHDVSMLGAQVGSSLLDRDQVWFTEKSEDGATELFPLTDLRPRKGENVERGYLAGRYGAAPNLSPGELVRAALLAGDADVA